MQRLRNHVVLKGLVVSGLLCLAFFAVPWRSVGVDINPMENKRQSFQRQLTSSRVPGSNMRSMKVAPVKEFQDSTGVGNPSNTHKDKDNANLPSKKRGKNRTKNHTKRANKNLQYWMSQRVHTEVLADKDFHPLTTEQVQEVEKFLFFTGYPRSGHSIVGSFLDSHPSIALSFAFFLFRRLILMKGKEGNIEALLQNKTLFFNTLYERSYHYSLKSGKSKRKGYTLDVPGLWSGKFEGRLRIIGDKSALPTSLSYENSIPLEFKAQYKCLQDSVGVPLLGIHVVRNPFDMISTQTLYKQLEYSWKKEDKDRWSEENQYDNETALQQWVEYFFDKAKAVQDMVTLCGMNVLEIHNEDLVQNPRKELKRMCLFLGLDCPELWIKACESKTYRNVSRTRDKVHWTPFLRSQVEENMKKYSFFRGYTFEDDYYNPPG